MENALRNARLLSKALEATGWYECVSDIHRPKGQHEYKGKLDLDHEDEGVSSADFNAGLPVVAFHFTEDFKKQYPHIKQESVSTLMRVKQYIIPSMQKKAESVTLLILSQTIPSLPMKRNKRFCVSSYVRV